MSLRNRLKNQLRDRQFRHAYADEQLNLSIATQIKVIRENQKMSQATLAGKIGTKQAGISRIESANYDGWSIAILRRLAEAFDLRLRVSFEEFGTLWKEVDDFSRESLLRRRFDDDPEFKEADKPKAEEIAALTRQTITPTAPHVPRLSDLVSAVTEQNEELRKSLIASSDLSPIIAALTSQQEAWRADLARMTEAFVPVNTYLQGLQSNDWAQFAHAFTSFSLPPNIASIYNPYPESKEGTMAATSYITPTANEAVELTAVRAPVIPIDQHRNQHGAKKRPSLKRYQVGRGIGRRKHG